MGEVWGQKIAMVQAQKAQPLPSADCSVPEFTFRYKWQGQGQQSPEAGSMLAASESEQTLRGRIREGGTEEGNELGKT